MYRNSGNTSQSKSSQKKESMMCDLSETPLKIAKKEPTNKILKIVDKNTAFKRKDSDSFAKARQHRRSLEKKKSNKSVDKSISDMIEKSKTRKSIKSKLKFNNESGNEQGNKENPSIKPVMVKKKTIMINAIK